MASPTQYENEPTQDAGAGDIGGRIEELRAELARLTEQVQIYLQDRASDLRDSALEATESVEEIVRENPLPAVGIAFGAGFVLGLMARSGRSERWEPPRLSRRDLDRLASSFTEALMTARSRAREATAGAGDAALLERLTGIVSGLLESSKGTVASVGTAGERAARSVAAMGEKTARGIADRLSVATR